jgi:hypothetical protein
MESLKLVVSFVPILQINVFNNNLNDHILVKNLIYSTKNSIVWLIEQQLLEKILN